MQGTAERARVGPHPPAALLGLRDGLQDAVGVHHIAQVEDALQVRAGRLEVRQADRLPRKAKAACVSAKAPQQAPS